MASFPPLANLPKSQQKLALLGEELEVPPSFFSFWAEFIYRNERRCWKVPEPSNSIPADYIDDLLSHRVEEILAQHRKDVAPVGAGGETIPIFYPESYTVSYPVLNGRSAGSALLQLPAPVIGLLQNGSDDSSGVNHGPRVEPFFLAFSQQLNSCSFDRLPYVGGVRLQVVPPGIDGGRSNSAIIISYPDDHTEGISLSAQVHPSHRSIGLPGIRTNAQDTYADHEHGVTANPGVGEHHIDMPISGDDSSANGGTIRSMYLSLHRALGKVCLTANTALIPGMLAIRAQNGANMSTNGRLLLDISIGSASAGFTLNALTTALLKDGNDPGLMAQSLISAAYACTVSALSSAGTIALGDNVKLWFYGASCVASGIALISAIIKKLI